MKKSIFLFVIFIVISLLFINNKKEIKKENEVRGVFISYIELNEMIKDKDKTTSKNNIKKCLKNIKSNYFNTIFLQVRSHNDSIYKSKLYETSDNIILNDNTYYDVLNYFIKESKKYNIDLYIWINPFRLGKKYINNSYKYGDYYYYNPANKETNKIIINGIKELIDYYKFKGIIFDDYFYVSDDIDKEEYSKINNTSLKEFHLNNITNFIKDVHDNIKSKNKDILFGISPSGNIDNLYNKDYVDIKKLTSSNKYLDFVMPQVYYGFYNKNMPFLQTIKRWDNISNIKIIYALSFYKVGNIDNYSLTGSNEWIDNNNIIQRELILTRNTKNYIGFSIYRYDNLFNKDYFNTNTIIELNNLKKTLKK